MALQKCFLVCILVFFLHLVLPSLSSISVSNHSPYVSDVCDWQGSGSPSVDSDRSVVPSYLRCARGSVKWLYPKGGLRVVLRLGTSNKDFRGCIRVSANSTQTVRIYLEGKRQLHQIYAPNDGKHPDLLRCFVSVHAFMALFIETDPNGARVHNQDQIAFDYDLQAAESLTTPEDDMSECRPCSPAQMLSLFCSADFVLSGKVTYYHHRSEVQMTEFTVKPTFMFRFPVETSYVNDYNATLPELENAIPDVNPFLQIKLIRPLKCAAGAAPRTEYLFLGKKILGNYFITCAPRMSDWRRISRQAVEAGTNQCHII